MPSVVVHNMIVGFDTGRSLILDADDVHALTVVHRRLSVSALPTQRMLDMIRAAAVRSLVNSVTFVYTAADGHDYETRIEAGGPGDIDAADQIRYRRVGQEAPIELLPVVPRLIAAGEIRPKGAGDETFAVASHRPRTAESSSKLAELAWHRWDCTWYYPY